MQAMTYLGFGKGGAWRARRVRACNGGLGVEPPVGSRGRAPEPPVGFRGRAPGRGVRGGKAPLKLKHFLLLNVQWKPQICPFSSEIRKCRKSQRHIILYRYEKRPSNIVEFCNSCWKTAKNAPFRIKLP